MKLLLIPPDPTLDSWDEGLTPGASRRGAGVGIVTAPLFPLPAKLVKKAVESTKPAYSSSYSLQRRWLCRC